MSELFKPSLPAFVLKDPASNFKRFENRLEQFNEVMKRRQYNARPPISVASAHSKHEEKAKEAKEVVSRSSLKKFAELKVNSKSKSKRPVVNGSFKTSEAIIKMHLHRSSSFKFSRAL